MLRLVLRLWNVVKLALQQIQSDSRKWVQCDHYFSPPPPCELNPAHYITPASVLSLCLCDTVGLFSGVSGSWKLSFYSFSFLSLFQPLPFCWVLHFTPVTPVYSSSPQSSWMCLKLSVYLTVCLLTLKHLFTVTHTHTLLSAVLNCHSNKDWQVTGRSQISWVATSMLNNRVHVCEL